MYVQHFSQIESFNCDSSLAVKEHRSTNIACKSPLDNAFQSESKGISCDANGLNFASISVTTACECEFCSECLSNGILRENPLPAIWFYCFAISKCVVGIGWLYFIILICFDFHESAAAIMFLAWSITSFGVFCFSITRYINYRCNSIAQRLGFGTKVLTRLSPAHLPHLHEC